MWSWGLTGWCQRQGWRHPGFVHAGMRPALGDGLDKGTRRISLGMTTGGQSPPSAGGTLMGSLDRSVRVGLFLAGFCQPLLVPLMGPVCPQLCSKCSGKGPGAGFDPAPG